MSGRSVAAALLACALVSGAATAGGKPLEATLFGRNEVPGPGDPDGMGFAWVRLGAGRGRICFELRVFDIAAATSAHIHRGAAGTAGPVVVTLLPPTTGESEGCVPVASTQVKEIGRSPANFYVNVHNAEYPSGALRGQLR